MLGRWDQMYSHLLGYCLRGCGSEEGAAGASGGLGLGLVEGAGAERSGTLG